MVEEFIRRFNLGEQPCYLMLPLIISLDMTSSIYRTLRNFHGTKFSQIDKVRVYIFANGHSLFYIIVYSL